MKTVRGPAIFVGIFFGFITFAITVFLMSPQLALKLGIFSATLFTLVLSLILDNNKKKYKDADSYIDGDILLKDTVNYYSNKLILNGILYLTSSSLIFLSFEKKPYYREEIFIRDIERATYGKVSRYVQGMKVFMTDSTVKGFSLKEIEPFLDGINKLINLN